MKKYKVCIIGASISGSIAGLLLARLGIKPAIIDKDEFPRRKACGEGLSASAVKHLTAMGLDNQIMSLPSSKFYGFNFYREGTPVNSLLYSKNKIDSFGIGISRYYLDNLILKNAALEGADLYLGEQPIIAKQNDRFQIKLKGQIIEAEYLVLACGGNSQLPKQLGVINKKNETDRWALSMGISNKSTKRDTVSITSFKGLQSVLAPIGKDQYNLNILGNKSKFKPPLESEIKFILEDLSHRFNLTLSQETEILYASGIGRYKNLAVKDNIFIIGDTLEQFDPIGGMGMTHAIISAKAAANTLSEIINKIEDKGEQFKKYALTMEKSSRKLRGFTRLAYFHTEHLSHTPKFADKILSPLARSAISNITNVGHSYVTNSVITSLLLNISGLNI